MLTLGFAVHNHQPVGNFDVVMARAHDECYRAFLDTVRKYAEFRFSMHWSGPLFDWIGAQHPETLDLFAKLATADRVEPMGGAHYEPILPMLPDRDRVGQIEMMSAFLRERFGRAPAGMWLAERVWEQAVVKTLADAGLRFTAVDDAHFGYAGFAKEELTGWFLAEDRGRTIGVFPIDEELRYRIPFAAVEEVIAYLREWYERFEHATIVYADDGEKFGVWPGTYKHCYKDGWLERFIEAVLAERSWLRVAPLGDIYAEESPLGVAYLPDASYREMMEWALPIPARKAYEKARKHLDALGGADAATLLRGAGWRSFLRKYDEARQMYGRMIGVSEAVADMRRGGRRVSAERALYQAQCNCAYWHGVFGGLYLPHLRFATYARLIEAERLALPIQKGVCLRTSDVDLDGHNEIWMSSRRLSVLVAPRRGGHIIEMDVREKNVNLVHTLRRRPEFYHDELLAAIDAEDKDAADGRTRTIHAEVRAKTKDLEQFLRYDAFPRESLIDHLLPADAGPEALENAPYGGVGDLPSGPMSVARLDNRETWGTIELERVFPLPEAVGTPLVGLVKQIRLHAESNRLTVRWRLEGPEDARATRPLRLATEWTFTLLAGDAPDRFYCADGHRLGNLSTRLSLPHVKTFRVVDEFLGIETALAPETPADVWTFPIWTVSSSEAGCEKTFQGATVVLSWPVPANMSATFGLGIAIRST